MSLSGRYPPELVKSSGSALYGQGVIRHFAAMRKYAPIKIMAAEYKESFLRIGPAQFTSFWLSCSITWASPIDESPLRWETHSRMNLSGCGIERLVKISPHPDRIQRHVVVQRYEVLALNATGGRTQLEAIFFIREALKYCIGRPIIFVDHGPWYPPALERLGLQYNR